MLTHTIPVEEKTKEKTKERTRESTRVIIDRCHCYYHCITVIIIAITVTNIPYLVYEYFSEVELSSVSVVPSACSRVVGHLVSVRVSVGLVLGVLQERVVGAWISGRGWSVLGGGRVC